MMGLLAQQSDSGLIQLIFVIGLGAVWVLSFLVKRSRRQQQTQQTRPGQPPAAQPPGTDALSQVRKFFETIQQEQAEPRTEPRMATPVRARRPRRRAKVVPVKAPEEPESTESLAERMRRQDAGSPEGVRAAAVRGRAPRRVGLEGVVANPRLSPAARAIVLSEIMGSPTALRPHRSPFEME